MSLRLFAALEIPDEIALRVKPLQKGVLGAAWRPRAALHLTLRFYGELEEREAEALDDELGRIGRVGFDVTLKGAGWFGGERPTTLWLSVAENPSLKALAEECDRAARRAGLPPEPRPFTPHLTLAYCKGTGPEDAAKFVQRLALFESKPFLADRFFLYSSWPGKRVSQYVQEAEYPLMG